MAPAPSQPPSPGLIDTCRECGAQALELMGQLQDQKAVQQAQPGLVRTPLQGILQLGQVRCTVLALIMGGSGAGVRHGSPNSALPSSLG